MRTKVVLHTVGLIMMVEAALLIIPAIVGMIYHEAGSVRAFVIAVCVTAAAGGLLMLVKPAKNTI